MSGQWEAERSRLEARLRAVSDDDVGLCLRVAVVDDEAPCLLEDRAHLGIEVIARGDQPAQLGRPEAPELRVLSQCGVLGGGLVEDRRAEAVDEVEPLQRLELALVEQGLGAARPRAEEGVPDADGGAGRSGGPDGVAATCVEPVLGRHSGGEHRRIRMGDEMRPSGGPRAGEHEREVACRGVVGRSLVGRAQEERLRLVDVEDVRTLDHANDLGLSRPRGDD